jgi:hypothetical protein
VNKNPSAKTILKVLRKCSLVKPHRIQDNQGLMVHRVLNRQQFHIIQISRKSTLSAALAADEFRGMLEKVGE